MRRFRLRDREGTPLSYAGSKQVCAHEIARLLPSARRIIEPFAGSAAITLAAMRRDHPRFEAAVLNDVDPPVTNFWRHLRASGADVTAEAEQIIERFDLYELSNERFRDLTQERCPEWAKKIAKDAHTWLIDRLEEPTPLGAGAFYVFQRCTYGAKGRASGSLSLQRMAEKLSPSIVGTLPLWSKALNAFDLSVTQRCWSEVVAEADRHDVIVLDPPYWNGQYLYGKRGALHKKFVRDWFVPGRFYGIANELESPTLVTVDDNAKHVVGLGGWTAYRRPADYKIRAAKMSELVFVNYSDQFADAWARVAGWRRLLESDQRPESLGIPAHAT